MKKYTAVIQRDGDFWVGWIEELPGVNSQGATRKELMDNLRSALAEALEMNRSMGHIDWNAELVRGDLGEAVQRLKGKPGKRLFVGGVKLALALTELGLIDEYEFVVHPRLAGHGPTLFAGQSRHADLKLDCRVEFGTGAGCHGMKRSAVRCR